MILLCYSGRVLIEFNVNWHPAAAAATKRERNSFHTRLAPSHSSQMRFFSSTKFRAKRAIRRGFAGAAAPASMKQFNVNATNL